MILSNSKIHLQFQKLEMLFNPKLLFIKYLSSKNKS